MDKPPRPVLLRVQFVEVFCIPKQVCQTDLMAISEFLAEPTEKQIARSFARWKEFYAQEYKDTMARKRSRSQL